VSESQEESDKFKTRGYAHEHTRSLPHRRGNTICLSFVVTALTSTYHSF